MVTSPVRFDVVRPPTMARAHVALRILILVLTSWLTGSTMQLGIVYVGLPVLAAVLIAQKDGSRYVAEDGERVTRWLEVLVGLIAYLALLTDELPLGGRRPVRFAIDRSGAPTVGSALVRILKAIPSALALALIGIVSWIVWVLAAVSILFSERYPESLWNFQRGVVRFEARLLAYLASLVTAYPPFALDTGPEGASAPVD